MMNELGIVRVHGAIPRLPQGLGAAVLGCDADSVRSAFAFTGVGRVALVIESCIDCKHGVCTVFGMTWCGNCEVYLHPHEVVKRYV